MLTLPNLATVEWPENVSARLNLIHFLIPHVNNGIDILMLIFFLVDTYLVLILNVNK